MSSIAALFSSWDVLRQARYLATTDRNWDIRDVRLYPLAQSWHGKLQSLLAASNERLVLTAGETLYSYNYPKPGDGRDAGPAGVRLEGAYALNPSPGDGPRRDVTGLAFIPGSEDTLCLGFQDGSLECVRVPTNDGRTHASSSGSRTPYYVDAGTFIKAVSASRDRLLSISYTGRVSLFSTTPTDEDAGEDCETSEPFYLDLDRKCWAAHLSLIAPSPFAAFGSTSSLPLTVHYIAEDKVHEEPSQILGSTASEHSRPAAYSITQPCADTYSPWGAPENIIVSGWFDGVVRCYDLRSPDQTGTDHISGQAIRRPVLSLHDPWAYEAFYSVAAGGGSGAHVVGGSARHALVAFWDVRNASRTQDHLRFQDFTSTSRAKAGSGASTGWSAYGQTAEEGSSPVYSMHLETSRLFISTQNQAFSFDFGVHEDKGRERMHDDLVMKPSASSGKWRRGGQSLVSSRSQRSSRASMIPVKYLHSSGHDVK